MQIMHLANSQYETIITLLQNCLVTSWQQARSRTIYIKAKGMVGYAVSGWISPT